MTPGHTLSCLLSHDPFICSARVRTNPLDMWAGTGSGSFSHSVARTIGPSGKLWSYEFHEARANKARYVSSVNSFYFLHALSCFSVEGTSIDCCGITPLFLFPPYREEFTRHGMSDTVTLTHRNVCKDGFTVTDEADASACSLHGAPVSLGMILINQLRRCSLSRLACPLGSHRARKESTQSRHPYLLYLLE